jgi:2-C-methyl-D-erythritol 4-phosphate cytidylyltransferase
VHEVGAAVCGMPVKNTIIECIEHKPFLRTLAREKLIEIYSPFAAKWKLIKKARNRAKREGYLNYPGFEDTCLFITDDMEVKIICDGYHNIKITTPEDLVFVSQLLKNYES